MNMGHTPTVGKFSGLLIGYGSVGWRHALKLAELTPDLTIVDTNADARSRALQAHPKARVAGSLKELDSAGFPWASTVSVIASWGPAHASHFHALADRGVRRILCEKPMAASVYDAYAMAARAERDKIALNVHHFIRFAGLVPALRLFLAEQQLGEPVSVVVEGGAACLLTNGIHWIDFAADLFGENPERVVSTAYAQPINPRSPNLMLYGGTSVWTFSSGREAVISLSNLSSLKLTTHVYVRDAVIEVDQDVETVVIRRRAQPAVAKFPAVTRTGPATESLFEGRLPGMPTYLDGIRNAVNEVERGTGLTCPGNVAAGVVGMCVGALLASRERKSIKLPLDLASPWGRECWPIS
jgi:predicted dehydrogenase